MFIRGRLQIYLLLTLLLIAACAPADLDITPTVDPAALAAANSAAAEVETGPSDEARALLDHLVASVPETFGTGSNVQWNRTEADPFIVERDTGITARLTFTERQGGEVEMTLAAFNDEASTSDYYDNRAADRRLEQGDISEAVPEPNLFGRSNFGSMAVWMREDVVLQVNIQINISTFGDVLTPLAAELDQIVVEALESYEG